MLPAAMLRVPCVAAITQNYFCFFTIKSKTLSKYKTMGFYQLLDNKQHLDVHITFPSL